MSDREQMIEAAMPSLEKAFPRTWQRKHVAASVVDAILALPDPERSRLEAENEQLREWLKTTQNRVDSLEATQDRVIALETENDRLKEEKMRVTEELAKAAFALQELRYHAWLLIKAWDEFNDPNIRVGPVHPRMNDLRKLLQNLDRAKP